MITDNQEELVEPDEFYEHRARIERDTAMIRALYNKVIELQTRLDDASIP